MFINNDDQVSGCIRLRYNLGSGPQSLSLGAALDRGRWHRVRKDLFPGIFPDIYSIYIY